MVAHYLDAEMRVRWSLVQLAETYRANDAIVVPLSQEELAELAGTTRATVNRVLREEEDRGVVSLRRRRVSILEAGTLKRGIRGLPAF